MDSKALRLYTLNQMTKAGSSHPTRNKLLDEEQEVLRWLTDQLGLLKNKFMPYMGFRSWK
jgi:hypothetical protein